VLNNDRCEDTIEDLADTDEDLANAGEDFENDVDWAAMISSNTP